MGSCFGPSVDANTREINDKMAEAEKQQISTYKLLFLGPGGSGKSTIFKQLQWLHGGGFSKQDALLLKDHIFSQIIKQMQNAIKYYLTTTSNDDDNNNNNNNIEEQDEKLQSAINTVTSHPDTSVFNESVATSVQYIWKNDKRLNGIFHKHFENKILDETTEYFWNDIDRIKADDYVPTQEDIINVRYRTTGAIQKHFAIDMVKFHIFDVGGQKSERKKWIYCFEGVAAVVFVSSLSCYNELMYEDLNKNCMVDSLELFHEIANHKSFIETPIILFLNKTDLYKAKLVDIPITDCIAFKDYDENKNANDYDQTTEYIKEQFTAQNKQKRKIYVHFTCAMDRKNVENVFNDVAKIMVEQITSAFPLM